MTTDVALPLEHFIQAVQSQLDNAQTAMAMKARNLNLPLTFAIKDITLEVVLKAEFNGWGPGMTEERPPLAAFSARTEIDREDWDMTWNMVVETGGFLVSRTAQIEIETELNLVQ